MNARRWVLGEVSSTARGAAVGEPSPRAGFAVAAWSRAWETVVLVLALAAFVAALAPALRESGTPPGWDPSVHLRDSLVYERILRHPGSLAGGVLRAILRGSEHYPLLTPSGYYPPLVPGVTALLYLVAGRSFETAMTTNILFLLLFVWGVRGLGDRLMGSPAGLVAALLVLAAPGIRANAAEYMLDLPLAAMVVLSTWLLLTTEGFSRRGRSLAFGALCGAGMLTKWSFFLFLAAPVTLVLAAGLRRAGGRAESVAPRWGNLALALGAGCLVMAPYYAPILPILIQKTVVHAGGAADGVASPFTVESVLFHLKALPRKLLGWPLTLTVAAGLWLFVRGREEERRARVFLGFWAASLYAIFTFAVANKQSRYLLPWLPVLALMAAGGLLGLWRSRAENRGRVRGLAVAGLLMLPVAGLAGGWRSDGSGDWQIRSLVDRLEQDLTSRPHGSGRVWRLGVIPDVREVNGPTFAYYVSRRDLPVTVVQLVNRMKRHVDVEVGLDPFDRGDFYQTFDEYDYLVDKTGPSAVPPWESVVPRMQAHFEKRRGEFDRLASFDLPEGSSMTLYRRRRG